jgi:hypothetical protein
MIFDILTRRGELIGSESTLERAIDIARSEGHGLRVGTYDPTTKKTTILWRPPRRPKEAQLAERAEDRAFDRDLKNSTMG